MLLNCQRKRSVPYPVWILEITVKVVLHSNLYSAFDAAQVKTHNFGFVCIEYKVDHVYLLYKLL